MRKLVFSTLTLSLCAFPTLAQERSADAGPGLTSFNMGHSVVVPLGEGEDAFAKQSTAMRSFFDMVAGSCATVLERIADTCEIASITYNARSGSEGNRVPAKQPEAIRVDGQVRMLVTLKPRVGPVSIQNSERRRQAPGQY